MDSSRSLFGIIVPSRGMGLFRLSTSKEESEMNLTTIAVDLASPQERNFYQTLVRSIAIDQLARQAINS